MYSPKQQKNTENIMFQEKLYFSPLNRNKKNKNCINDLIRPNTTIQQCFSTRKTSSFFPNKDSIPTDLASGLVYQYNCDQWSDCYIGDTKSHLFLRKGEHRRAKLVPSEVSLHVHNYREENFSLVQSARL